MKTLILFFTGTGNSYYIAKGLKDLMVNAHVGHLKHYEDYSGKDFDHLLVVLPVYYIHLPEVCIQLLRSIDYSKFNQIGLVASYAGNTGYAFDDFSKILGGRSLSLLKYSVPMPGNYLLEYGGFSDAKVNRMLLKADEKIREIAVAFNKGKGLSRGSINIISKGFGPLANKKREAFIGLGRGFSTNNTCTHCGLCQKLCPVDNISMDNNKVQWGDRCQQCMACIQFCPVNAIHHEKYKKGRRRYTNPKVQSKDLIQSIKG